MRRANRRLPRHAALAALVMAMAWSAPAVAQTTPAADAVAALCLTPLATLPAIAARLDAEPGLTRLDPTSLEVGGSNARALRMAEAWNIALEGIIGSDPTPPEAQVQRAFDARAAQPLAELLPYSEPHSTAGVLLYADTDGMLVAIQRRVTIGRRGIIGLRCHLIAPAGQTPPRPAAPDFVIVTATPSLSQGGFAVSALQGEILFDDPVGSAIGVSIVTMPVPADTPAGALAGIGGVTMVYQSIGNTTLQ